MGLGMVGVAFKSIKDLEEGKKEDGDSGTDVSPPEGFDMDKFNRGRLFFRDNLFSCSVVQLFRVRAGHSLLRSDMFRRKWSATTVCRLCGEENEDCSHVLFGCGELSGIRETDWSDITLQDALWGNPEGVLEHCQSSTTRGDKTQWIANLPEICTDPFAANSAPWPDGGPESLSHPVVD
ncbi:hypothetical protein PoB_002303000 [Plakobranchus ocellatus]|uniref:Reverse transcriptase zinc-binding domain-containing protein n=1 Tax=Plakobranchus ocellatus TaxID=259542 RepID=A0AAV3ZN27_9GAST|nr:hypothetical protein PoB_002303000 [Plakobranchus ocellatus]